MFVGTHKNKKKKKKVEEIIGNKRSRVGTNRRWLKMTQTDKEKLEAIKQVLSDTPARSGDDKETVAWYEKALDEIDKIIESNDTPTSLRYPK